LENQYKNLISNNYLVRKDGSKLEIVQVLSIENNILEAVFIVDQHKFRASYSINKINALDLIELKSSREFNTSQIYISSLEGKLVKARILDVEPTMIKSKVYRKEQYVDVDLSKNSITGIYFFDYLNNGKHDTKYSKTGKNSLYVVRIDGNLGFGYIMAPAADNLSSQEKEMVEDMRMGFNYEFGFNLFLSNYLGFRLNYNQLRTNSSGTINTDLKLSYFGGGVFVNIPINHNQAFLNISTTLGSMKAQNDMKISGYSNQLTGRTFSNNTTAGVDFLLNDHLAIGVNAGFQIASFREYTLGNDKVELEEPDNLSRFYANIGLRIYL
ncbi:MAG: hypothetical protein MI922_15610, partial [Bacteroidales bacterium]|nr:hypothetical protein [Bacteroidales bacterium]